MIHTYINQLFPKPDPATDEMYHKFERVRSILTCSIYPNPIWEKEDFPQYSLNEKGLVAAAQMLNVDIRNNSSNAIIEVFYMRFAGVTLEYFTSLYVTQNYS